MSIVDKDHCACGKRFDEESPDCVFNYHKKPEVTPNPTDLERLLELQRYKYDTRLALSEERWNDRYGKEAQQLKDKINKALEKSEEIQYNCNLICRCEKPDFNDSLFNHEKNQHCVHCELCGGVPIEQITKQNQHTDECRWAMSIAGTIVVIPKKCVECHTALEIGYEYGYRGIPCWYCPTCKAGCGEVELSEIWNALQQAQAQLNESIKRSMDLGLEKTFLEAKLKKIDTLLDSGLPIGSLPVMIDSILKDDTK